jgi:hypothetical protein
VAQSLAERYQTGGSAQDHQVLRDRAFTRSLFRRLLIGMDRLRPCELGVSSSKPVRAEYGAQRACAASSGINGTLRSILIKVLCVSVGRTRSDKKRSDR